MIEELDILLSKITARLRNPKTKEIIGTALLYYNKLLNDKVYIITAAHNLYNDASSFKGPLSHVTVELFNYSIGKFQPILKKIDYDLVSAKYDDDYAILVLDKDKVEKLITHIPTFPVLKERISGKNFVVKGFPNATQGEELASISPIWIQTMPGVSKFQLLLNEDYSSWATGGFSGSGAFLIDNNQLYLLGIFTRYRPEEKGKVIYCQYIVEVNKVLIKNFLSPISFSYFGEHGLTPNFFKQQVRLAIENLGPRYNERLNFRLPIAKLFNYISRDSIFKTRLLNVLDDWLTTHGYGFSPKDELIKDIENELDELKTKTKKWIQSVDWEVDKRIEIDFITETLDVINSKLDKRRDELYDLQSLENEKKPIDEKKAFNYRPPYESQINRLHEIIRLNSQFQENLRSINIFLSNNPYLLIQGEAGCGKSHLLGDISVEREKREAPTLLLLGQLFLLGQSAWQNVLSQLGLSCTKEQLLASLNNIGKQIGSRVLIMIDALNEGAGKQIWAIELSGFVNEFKSYPFIGIILTVRSTYYNIVIPESIKTKDEITKITHEGFKGNEYAALKLYCEHHELEQPNFPILSPEFSNPLFLQLICFGVVESESKKFPRGFQGINVIFKLYLDAIVGKLANRREEYQLRKYIIIEAIHELARAIFKEERLRAIKLTEAVQIFDSKYSGYKHLLHDLILENVFIQSTNLNYETKEEDEIIFFSYERLGDFYIAKELLEPFTTKEAVKKAFNKDQILGELVKDRYWRNRGVLEIMAILLPEKYDLEIVEAVDWKFQEKDDIYSHHDDWLNRFLLESLKWREVTSIDEKKLITWFNGEHFYVDQNELFNFLIELTTYVGNPFNSDRFFKILNRHTMAERDSFWLEYVRYYSTYDDNEVAFPYRRLMDWAWQPGISLRIDFETARLAGQTLAWLLASSKINLRDEATKILVNLLEEQPDSLLTIIESFKNCNDIYIVERLYGVAYGCTLRTSKRTSVQKIAQFVYDNIFKNSSPPPHILLRDYARNIVEYASFLKLKIIGDIKKIHPPYQSNLPKVFPSEKKIKAYEISDNAPDFKSGYGFYNNQIAHSVLDWDFGRYIVDPTLRQFTPVSFTLENQVIAFKRGLNKKQREWLELYEKCITLKHEYNIESDLEYRLGKKTYSKNLKDINHALREISQTIRRIFPKHKYQFFTRHVSKHLIAYLDSKQWQRSQFNTNSIKRWIVKRVFELGYNSKIHGRHDSSINYYNERSDNKFERIGKKYQWIALYEIIGMIADNYLVKLDGWSSSNSVGVYQGAWQSHLRNIDPAFITKRTTNTDDKEYEHSSHWWHVPNYNYWNRPDSKWVKSRIDLPDIHQIISVKDELGDEWLCLSASINWKNPKAIGEEKYGGRRKEIWYLLQGYIVRKKDKSKIVGHLNTRSFWNRWMPESHSANSSLFNRENYWSPAAKDFGNEEWQNIEGSNFNVMPTTSEAVGELSRDKSGAHFRYDMPCQMLFDGMQLQYSANDGDFLTSGGETVVINPDKRGVLIRKDLLLKYLKSKNLDIVWTLLGEKYSYETLNSTDNFFKVINGVYSFTNNKLTGSLRMTDRT